MLFLAHFLLNIGHSERKREKEDISWQHCNNENGRGLQKLAHKNKIIAAKVFVDINRFHLFLCRIRFMACLSGRQSDVQHFFSSFYS